MKTTKQDTTWSKSNTGYKWKLIALSIPLVMTALMLMSVLLVKGKVAKNYQVSSSYRAGDVAVFVAMPLLHAVLK